MKSFQAKIAEREIGNRIFTTYTYVQSYFTTEFHFHKECQLVYILESEGKRIVGDNVEHFESGELILLGPDLPHTWHNDKIYFEVKKPRAHSVSLYFHPTKLIEYFSAFADTKQLQKMLFRAKRGMKFKWKTKKNLIELLLQLKTLSGLSSILGFTRILEIICETKEFDFLASNGYTNTFHMNEQAFCRYFKANTRKSFVQFVNEIRIGQACKMLIHQDQSINAITYECGFNSISNFNRIFKAIKGSSPNEFKKTVGE
jgi:AraC-like DNA-binding protein